MRVQDGSLPPVLLWFRQDFRLADNEALCAAARTGHPVLPLYIETGAGGSAERWWRHHALKALISSLSARGLPLCLRKGNTLDVLRDVLVHTGACGLFWNKLYDPDSLRDTRDVMALCRTLSLPHVFEGYGALLHDPETVRTGSGNPYRVFTPFYRACLRDLKISAPLPEPEGMIPFSSPPPSGSLDALGLLPSGVPWHEKLSAHWSCGESAARTRLSDFVHTALADYAQGRDRPDKPLTSRLSPHLRHGEITPRQCLFSVEDACETFVREIFWREFCAHLLFHFPDIKTTPLQEKFTAMPWRNDPAGLTAWQKGRTGYPIVDAGMRQLWQTGWMHNRVRMITASFLVKDLLIDWREGERWFADCLVDHDPASNAANWQWVAGCGADAAPFFRIFNPVIQEKTFDPAGDYVRTYVPEHNAPSYPPRLIDHAQARARALAIWKTLA